MRAPLPNRLVVSCLLIIGGLARTLIAQLPLLIVCLFGICWSLARIDRDQRAAMFVLAGLGLYVLVGIGQVTLQSAIQQLLMQRLNLRPGSPNFLLSYSATSSAFNVLRAIALGLIATAAFVDRPIAASLVPGQPMR